MRSRLGLKQGAAPCSSELVWQIATLAGAATQRPLLQLLRLASVLKGLC